MKSLLVTGGAASGKSRFAVSYFKGCDRVLYLKSGTGTDKLTLNRIKADTEKYNVEWDTVLSDKLTPADEIGNHKFVIFDSLSSFTRLALRQISPTEVMMDLDANTKQDTEKRMIEAIDGVFEKVEQNNGNLVIITVETGFSLVPEDSFIAAYREILGRVNQRVANKVNEVYFSASGVQFKIK